jgi:hypothetical protein
MLLYRQVGHAQAAMKAAAEHMEKMSEMALKAAPMLLGPEGAAAGGLSRSNPSVQGAMENLASKKAEEQDEEEPVPPPEIEDRVPDSG